MFHNKLTLYNNSISRKHKSHKKGFTLAEILSVLVILGIVATMVIPSTINKYRKSDVITRLKMAYSILSNAVDESIIYNGPVSGWDFSLNSDNFAKTYLTPYMNILYECQYNNAATKCFYNAGSYINAFYMAPSCMRPPLNYNSASGSYQFRLKNGMSFAVYRSTVVSNDVRINIDINGPDKGKSIMGEDVFVFQLKKTDNNSNLQPYVYNDFWTDTCMKMGGDSLCGEGSQYKGGGRVGCAYHIIKNNWKIPKNYPFFK